MPLIKSGSKQAISTNIREMMHAGHPQDQSVAAALSTARRYGKKGTGGIVIGGKKVAPSIGGVMSKPPWKGYAEGGATDDIFNSADTGAMSPETFVNPLAKHMVAQSAMAAPNLVKNFVEGAQEYQPGDPETAGKITGASGDLIMQGLQSALPVKTPVRSAGAPVFVGPYGATRLRNDALLEGKTPTAHPVVKKSIEPELKYTSPKFRREAEAAQQDIMDEAAMKTLEARGAIGNYGDRDVFNKSGWSFGADLKPRKEIPDIGASFEKIPGTDKYEIKHPAGDFHKAYDIPPIIHDRGLIGKAQAMYNRSTGEIHIADPNSPEALSSALHELQHAIQHKEGFTGGFNPALSAEKPEFKQEYFPSEDKMPSWQKDRWNKEVKEKPHLKTSVITPEAMARYMTYERNAGETEARNVQTRFEKNLYKKHPEDTEDVTRGLQWRKRGGKTMASGGMMPPPWFVRSEARGNSGMLKSAIPGRTDKIPLNVPGGSYVLPADIPSALGQGNTMAGGTILDKMFNRGPYGMNLPRAHSGSGRPQMARMSSLTKVRKSGYAEGGNTGNAKIIAAGGEYIIHAHAVADIGGGDMDKGHKILDAFVKHVRDQHIKTLKKLPGPKKN